jgi:hypothetical protein
MSKRAVATLVVGAALLLVGYVAFKAPPALPEGGLRAVRDPGESSGYREEGHAGNGGFGFRLTRLNASSNNRAEPARLFVVYVRKMPADAIRAELREWIATDSSAEAIALFPNL